MSEIFDKSKWIWADGNVSAGDVVIVRKAFKVEKTPKTAIVRAAAESKYFLSVNGKYAIFDGGLLRESRPGCGYYDETDIAKLLVKGENVISAVVIYYGNDGRNSVCCGGAGFIFECPELELYSGETFSVFRNKAYCESGAPLPSGLSAGGNICYDATLESMLLNYQKPDFKSNIFTPATEYGMYGEHPWGELEKRPLPFFTGKFVPKARKIEKSLNKFVGDRYADVYTVSLPCAMNVFPYMEVFANSGDKIEVRSDRYVTDGSYDDEDRTYNGFRMEYICKAESQEFEFLQALHGEKLIFYIPSTVKVLALGYRESVYDSEETGYFRTDNDFINTLYDKCANTMLCCMRDNYMDTPERDRAMLPAFASIGAQNAYYMLDESAVSLAEKTLTDMLNFSDNDILYSFVPGNCRVEIPSQSLIALSEFGLAAQYFRYVGSTELLKRFYLAALRYLAKWDIGEDGFVTERVGNKAEYDHLYNCDKKLIVNLLYYSALKFTRTLAAEADDFTQSDYLSGRMETVFDAIAGCYDGKGYTSGGFYDERANALAVMCSVATQEQYPQITKILASVYTATPFYESFVLDALCRMGRGDLAFKRMGERYFDMVSTSNSTLREDFSMKGALCHLSGVSPMYIMYRYFAGVEIMAASGKITVTPDLRRLKKIEFGCEFKSGRISGKMTADANRTDIMIDNNTTADVTLVLNADFICRDLNTESSRVLKLNKGRNKFTL